MVLLGVDAIKSLAQDRPTRYTKIGVSTGSVSVLLIAKCSTRNYLLFNPVDNRSEKKHPEIIIISHVGVNPEGLAGGWGRADFGMGFVVSMKYYYIL